MTYYEKLINGTKEDLIRGFLLVTNLGRYLLSKDWPECMQAEDELEKLVREVLDSEV